MLIFISFIVGSLTGFSTGVGTARMFHAPEKQGLGAFRTLGEINACNGDPVSHAALGLGFFFNSAASAFGTGALTQDLIHRIIPNWSISLAAVFSKKKDNFQVMRSPAMLGIAGLIVGAITFPLIIFIYQVIPFELSNIATRVLSPAAEWLFKYVMPVIFLIAALDAGKKIGSMSLFFGVISQFVSGNAIPGIILGIIVGSSWVHAGWKSLQFWFLLLLVVAMFILIAYFRGITWDKIITLEPVKNAVAQVATDFKQLANINLDAFTHPGIMNEV